MNFTVVKPEFKNKFYNILDFGAKSDFEFNNKAAIQAAIDKCNKEGGGTVVIPSGFYLTGPIEIKSNVNLKVEEGAYVKFTKNKEEYPLIFTEYEGIKKIRAISPISAKNAVNIAITGTGAMDGSGDLWRGIKKFKLTEKEWERCLKKSPYVFKTGETEIWCPTKTYYDGICGKEPDYEKDDALEIASLNWDMYRPVFVSFQNCDKVLIKDVTLLNSPAWNVHPLYCTNFTMDNAIIKNKFSAQNGDGIDLESCQNCEISNTVFEVGDDGICIKSGKNKKAREKKVPTKNVWIHDCKVFDAHGGFVVGSEMSRGVSNILVENCTFSGTDIGIRFKSAIGRGGVVEDITIRNISMVNILGEAMIFTMGYVLVNIEDTNEGKVTVEKEDVPEFKNITIDNIKCNSSKIALKVLGLPELPIHDITVKNSQIAGDKDFDLKLCNNITIENTDIATPAGVKHYDNEVFNA
ncbi:MAG: glycoside hydrolase family 28 protein [Acholeplasmatales bacterium]|nr:glycoside hydrolase family 28 protein [Acholeplasmatales bacterium]